MKVGKRRALSYSEEFGRLSMGGYTEFRYGSRRPIYDPARQAKETLKVKQDGAVNAVEKVLRRFTISPFQHEADCRHGLRSSFCLNGTQWPVADLEAQTIVSRALANMNAKRPSWLEGQRQYTLPKENCLWCGDELPGDLAATTLPRSFCSEVCAKSATLHWQLQARTDSDRIYRAAARVIEKRRLPTRECVQCHRTFHPRFGKEKFCSPECGGAHRRVHFEKPCAYCGSLFQSRPSSHARGGESRFCSRDCASAYKSIEIHETNCQVCGNLFAPKSRKALTCSKRCEHIWLGWMPKRIAPDIFDFLVTLPVNAHTGQITPARFDAMLMAA